MKPKDFAYLFVILLLIASNLAMYSQYDIYRATTFEKNFYIDKLTDVGSVLAKNIMFDAKLQKELSTKYKITKHGDYYNLMPLEKRNVQNNFWTVYPNRQNRQDNQFG